jgi:hypothetical protein
MGRGNTLGLATEGSSALPAAQGRREAAAVLTGEARWWNPWLGGGPVQAVGAVQGERLRQGRRSGAGVVELRCGDSLLLALLFSSTPFLSSSAGAAMAGREKQERLGFGGEARVLILGARVREWLRPGVLDGWVGTRGGIAAARASRGRAAVKARWKGEHGRLCPPVAKWGGARAGW